MTTPNLIRAGGRLTVATALIAIIASAGFAAEQSRTVHANVQTRPGGPRVETDMAVHEVPVDLPVLPADRAPLEDEDLVLGVVRDGQPKAFPVRFLSMFEVIDDAVGKTPVAPTW